MQDFNLKHFLGGCLTALVVLMIYSYVNKPETQAVSSGQQVEVEVVEYE